MAEGGKDNSDGTANSTDTFTSNTINTVVRALDVDFVAGHSLAGGPQAASYVLRPGFQVTCNDAAFALGETDLHDPA